MMNDNKQLPSTTGAWVLMVLCLLYGVSPVDIIPDIPVVGQIDDLIILASGGLNLVQRYMERAESSLASVVKVVKWIVIALGAIVILLLALFAVAIVNLFKYNAQITTYNLCPKKGSSTRKSGPEYLSLQPL